MTPEFLTLALPFFFVLAVVYGALEVSDLFKKPAVKALISIIIAFFSITNSTVVALIYQFLPYAALFFLVFFFFGFLYSFFKKEEKKDPTLVVIILGLLLIFLVERGEETLSPFSFPGLTQENFMAAVGLFVIVVIFFAAYQHYRQES